MANKPRGTPFIDLGDPADIEVGTQEQADFIEAFCIGVPDRTTAQRDAEPAWVGKLIFNKTLGVYQACVSVGPAVWSSDPINLAAHSGGLNGADKHIQKLAGGKTAAALPSSYPTGKSWAEVLVGDGWPVTGLLKTTFNGGVWVEQTLMEVSWSGARFLWRFGAGGDNWGGWHEIGQLDRVATWAALQTFAAGLKIAGSGVQELRVESTGGAWAGIFLRDGDATADKRNFRVRSENAMLRFLAVNDAESSETAFAAFDDVGKLFLGAGTLDAALKRESATIVAARNAADSLYIDLKSAEIRTLIMRKQDDTTRTLRWGSGSPEGAITASTGSVYLRIDGGEWTSAYIKTSGTGNTGWKPMRPHIEAKSVVANAGVTWTEAFTVTPVVVATIVNEGATGAGQSVRVQTRSTTGATFAVNPADGDADAQIMVIAFEPT